jgi:hypothetical protein
VAAFHEEEKMTPLSRRRSSSCNSSCWSCYSLHDSLLSCLDASYAS